jgi:4-hydroxy-2-oxoheptanedioate aldolase
MGAVWVRHPLPELVLQQSANLFVVIQIEDTDAVGNIDQLLELEWADVFFVGPTDLSTSMGYHGDKRDPRVRDEVERVIQRIAKAETPAGVLAGNPEKARRFVELGVRWVAFNAESLLYSGSQVAREAARAHPEFRSS